MRPTSGRVRVALFNVLAARLAGARVLDLYAGTGALGLEALHRGAASAVFVERDPRMAEEIRRSLAGAGLKEAAEVWQRDALSAIGALAAAARRFDLIMLDPPYGRGLVDATLRRLAECDLLTPGGVIAAEGHWRDAPERVAGLVMIREARYGETALWLFEREKEAR
ncbi:MAG: 16S rRNA (guanine(966)-N(2))-methyltransferase RsmD [Armatimonadetes bacterium]|nr:16S rRNA (guanine(966)-N(2))-methyltransferase RsmD [Armatimonadota bacterium]